MLAFLLAGTVSIGLCALGWGLLRRCGVNSLPELYRRGNRLTAAVFEGITAAVLFGAALSTVMNAAGFLTAAVYPGAGAQVIAAAIVLTAAYGAYSGAEALSRLALPVALVFLAGAAAGRVGCPRPGGSGLFLRAGAGGPAGSRPPVLAGTGAQHRSTALFSSLRKDPLSPALDLCQGSCRSDALLPAHYLSCDSDTGALCLCALLSHLLNAGRRPALGARPAGCRRTGGMADGDLSCGVPSISMPSPAVCGVSVPRQAGEGASVW